MKIYCCGCETDIDARLTDGKEIYSHRKDLWSLPFWKCDGCNNFVGCHHKTKDRTRPLGSIPTPAIRTLRQQLHAIIDPLWRDGPHSRGEVYKAIADGLGVKEFHVADVRSKQEAMQISSIIQKFTRFGKVSISV